MKRQDLKEMILPGDIVYRLVTVSPDKPRKRVPMRVIRVVGGSIEAVLLSDGREITVHSSEIDRDAAAQSAALRKEKEAAALHAAQQEEAVAILPPQKAAPAAQPTAPVPAAVPAVHTPSAARSEGLSALKEAARDFSAIVDMAAAVEAQLAVAQAEILQRARELHTQQATIERELDVLAETQRDITQRLEVIRALRK